MAVIDCDDLPYSGSSHELEGYLYSDAPASLIFFDGPPGSGPRLHRHPYAEIFVVQEGHATFTGGPLRQIDIHMSDRFVTEWLKD